MSRSILTIIAFIGLVVVGIAGWVRTPSSVSAMTPLTPATFSSALTPAQPAADQTPTASARPVYRTQYVAPRRVKHRRPFSHSVAIVGGSAGAGAAIGAIAGGGKGAAIGALSGGTAGLIYDRLTHNR